MVWMYRDACRPQPTVAPSPVTVPVVKMPVPAKSQEEAIEKTTAKSRRVSEPSSEVEIRTPLIDYPIHVKANPGDFVQQGQIVIDLGDSKLEESVRQAEAALNVVKTEFQARQARLALPANDPTSLVAATQRGPSPAGRRGTPAAQKPGSNAEDKLDQTRLQQAEAGLARAKAALAETRIAAPIAGYVTQRIADGELSKPDLILLRIVDISSVRTVVQPGAEIGSKIVADQEAHVVLTDMPGRTFVGKVVRKSTAAPRVHVAGVTVEIPNPESVLKPGMYARVRLMFDQNNEPRLAPFAAWLGKSAHGRGPDGKLAGPQSDAELLTNLKGLTQSMSSMASELEHREQAAKITGEASRQHFLALEKLLGHLREDSTTTRKSSFEKTAEAIDNLPALHVDDELLAFSSDVAKALREMAEYRRAIGRDTGGVDWTYWDVTQRAAGAVKSQGLQRINTAMTEMRRKLTRKYNLEFLMTADRTQSSHRAPNRSHP